MELLGEKVRNRSEILGFKGWKFEEPQKYHPFWFEKIEEEDWANFFYVYWAVPFFTGALYLVGVFSLKNYMRDREAFGLKRTLFAWNAGLGLFSLLGFVRTAPELYGIVSSGPNGFVRSVCSRDGLNKPLAFWVLAFVLSKHVELGDTFFIILRKRPLVLLQWYHHAITLIASWTAGMYVEPIGRWYSVMNYGVHSLMYPYFALRVMNIRPPALVATVITTLQLTQMLVGLFVNFYTVHLINSGVDCDRHPDSVKLFMWIYGSFTLLFGNLFYESVIASRILKQKKKQADINKNN